MNTKPILFSTAMVRAILDDRKTQTRRIIKPQPEGRGLRWCPFDGGYWETWHGDKVNDTWCRNDGGLYVRETYAIGEEENAVIYKADNPTLPVKWKPSIHMPKKYARIFLKVKRVYIQQIQDITDEECQAEGIRDENPKEAFQRLWQKTYGKEAWDKNPWVWIIEFERVKK